jgi:hypothetical protein
MQALVSGLAGAATVTLVHETVRRQVSSAPRADILGVRVIENVMMAANQQPPTGDQLHKVALAADIASNAAYYSLVGAGKPRGGLWRGLALGLFAGIGGITLPGPLGLGEAPTERSPETQAMTVAWYVLGGLVAGLVYQLVASRRDELNRLEMMT